MHGRSSDPGQRAEFPRSDGSHWEPGPEQGGSQLLCNLDCSPPRAENTETHVSKLPDKECANLERPGSAVG